MSNETHPETLVRNLTTETLAARTAAEHPARATSHNLNLGIARTIDAMMAVDTAPPAVALFAALVRNAENLTVAGALAATVPTIDVAAGDALADKIDAIVRVVALDVPMPGWDATVPEDVASMFTADVDDAPPPTWLDVATTVVSTWRATVQTKASPAVARRSPRADGVTTSRGTTSNSGPKTLPTAIAGTFTTPDGGTRNLKRGGGTPTNSLAATVIDKIGIGGTPDAVRFRNALAAWLDGGAVGPFSIDVAGCRINLASA